VDVKVSDEHFDIGFYLVSLGVCFVVYFGIGDNGFYKDDYLWLRAARDDMDIGNVFAYRLVGFFRPLTNLAFFVTERIGPGSSAFYNNINLLIHYANGVLAFRVLRRLFHSRFVPAAASLLFIAAYTHSGAVIWVSARTTLLMTSFLLGALFFALDPRYATRVSVAALLFYTLSLATKETAVAGLGLVVALYLALRQSRNAHPSRVSGATVVGFAVISVAYVVLRTIILQSTFQDNWGPGSHVAPNILGAVLYVYYPWILKSLYGAEGVLRGSIHPLWPELLAIPLVACLLLLARLAGRLRGMVVAVSWLTVGLVPAAFFRFRFLSMMSHVHNRYYYLASVGAALSIALFLGWLWERRGAAQPSRSAGVAQITAVALLLAALLSSAVPLRGLERYWGDSNRRFGSLVATTVQYLDERTAQRTVVVSGLDGWQPFLCQAAQYYRPERPIVYIKGGAEEAAKHAPCLYVVMNYGTDRKVSMAFREIE
jgi:hypothetical protein